MMKIISILFSIISFFSCGFFNEESMEIKRMTLHWHNKEIIFPSNTVAKVLGKDTMCDQLFQKKYKILTYIDSTSCTACNFNLLDWKKIIHETDSLTKDVSFLFFAHIKDYKDFENREKMNSFYYPIFYDTMGECDKLNHFPKHVFYQTFLLDKNNRVLLLGKPQPNNKVWKLYKKIITNQ